MISSVFQSFPGILQDIAGASRARLNEFKPQELASTLWWQALWRKHVGGQIVACICIAHVPAQAALLHIDM